MSTAVVPQPGPQQGPGMMALPINPGSEDQTSITWRDPNYPHALVNRFIALHYFELSPFFDRACNNTLARQQGRDPAVPGSLESVAPQGGVEYVIELEQPPNLFVVRKQLRRGQDITAPGALTALSFYYILDSTVYQAPNLLAALKARLRRCVSAMHTGLQQFKADLDPVSRVVREHAAKLTKQADQEAADAAAAIAADATALDTTGGLALGGRESASPPPPPAPIPVHKAVSVEEAAHWKRTDNIILTVLSRYSIPKLPDVYYRQQQQQQIGAPAAAPQQDGAAQQGAAGQQELGAAADTGGQGGVAAATGGAGDGLAAGAIAGQQEDGGGQPAKRARR